MLCALETARLKENAECGGKAPDEYDFRHVCAIIAEMAGFKCRSEWMDILNGNAELVDN